MNKNFTGWDLSRIRDLKKTGKILGFTAIEKPMTENAKIVAKHFKRKSKEKEFIAKNLFHWCQTRGLKLYQEHVFDCSGQRGYKFDWSIPDLKIAIEYEGLMSAKSGHTTIAGFTKDTLKYNLATAQGWRLIRLTALTYQNLLTELKNYDKPGKKIS